MLRFGIRCLVESSFTVDQVAEAEHSLAAYALAPHFAPDLAIVQDALPGVTGMMSARMLRQLLPAACVIVLADNPELAARAAGDARGVDALLPTAIEPADLASAIREFERPPTAPPRIDASALEIALLDGLTRNATMESIGSMIGQPIEMLNDGLTSLLTRFEATDPASLIVNAIRRGWIDPQAQLPGAGPPVSFAVAA